MFKSNGLFANIICPYIEDCFLPNCLFSHQKPVNAADNEGPRKRRRIDTIPAGTTNSEAVSITQPLIRATVSPPPKKRITAPEPISLQKRIDSPKAAVTIGHIKSKSAPVLPPKPAKIGKSEELNPRMIKSAPASHDMRFRLVKLLHDQLVRLNDELATVPTTEAQNLVLPKQELICMALDAEETAAVGKPTVYSNIIKNKIMAYKRMKVEAWKAERANEKAGSTISPSAKVEKLVLMPVPDSAGEESISGPIETGLGIEQECSFLSRLSTPLEGLSKHGYVTQVPSEDEVEKSKEGLRVNGGWQQCDRCRVRFRVYPGRREEDGALTSGGTCTHHWGKPYVPDRDPQDPKASRAKRFRCCGELVGDTVGCTTKECHVFKISETKSLAAILQFEATPKSPKSDRKFKGPICIDGEMGYTVHGLELIRLTATAWPSGDELMDVLVRPIGEILDLNSRWSGVWPEEFANAVDYDPSNDLSSKIKPVVPKQLPIVSSPVEARDLLYKFIAPTTPIIGHGLENDLNALRLVHPTIIDTVFLYPHRAGLPFRNGLKNLMLKHLGRHIQTANIDTTEDGKGGHDSKEDARAAGELVRLKIKNEWARMKLDGWRLNDKGEMKQPDNKLTVEYLEDENSIAGDEKKKSTQPEMEQTGSQSTKRKASALQDPDDIESGKVFE